MDFAKKWKYNNNKIQTQYSSTFLMCRALNSIPSLKTKTQKLHVHRTERWNITETSEDIKN